MHAATTTYDVIHNYRFIDVLWKDKFGKTVEHSELLDSDCCCGIDVGISVIMTKF